MLTILTKWTKKVGIRTRRQFRLTLRAIAIIIGACSGYAIALLLLKPLVLLSVIPFIILLFSSFFEFILADLITEHSYPFDTEKKLDLLERKLGDRAVQSISQKLERVITSFKACDQSKISGTVHLKVELAPSPEEKLRYGLLQLTNYVGPRGGNKGRIATLYQGIIGRCARTARIEHVNFADEAEYRNRMVDEFGFSKEEAALHTAIARSYIAIPIVKESLIVGVLYFFSTEPQVFPAAARDVNLMEQTKDILDVLRTASIV